MLHFIIRLKNCRKLEIFALLLMSFDSHNEHVSNNRIHILKLIFPQMTHKV
jgi:hypothetical protein